MSTITKIQKVVPDKFILAVAAGQTYCSKNREEEQWDYPGNKVRFHRERLGGFLCPNRCPRDCCTPSRYVGACACGSAEFGSPIVSMSFCSLNPPVIQWPTSRRPTFLQTRYNAPNIPRGTRISGSRPGTPSGPATTARCEGHGNTSSCPATLASFRHGSHSPGQPWTPSTKKTNGSWAMPPIVTIASTSGRPPVGSWSATVIASSPIPS